ncbi:MAG TPA: class I SAM-dependent methyltransferase [Dermatophilaceae bacterium]|nr:class I SAM-dependent methyltransferase [Dermatophilaceae bacterium]
MISHALPELVRLATEQAASTGFMMSCDPDTGRLLAALSAAVPTGGRILELGTGTGVGTAWITHGLHDRTDVEVLTVEIDPTAAAVAMAIAWPDWVHLTIGDAVEITRRSGTFDLIFADAQGGKWTGLDVTLAALRPGAHLLVDDMQPVTFVDDNHARKTSEVRDRLHNHRPGQRGDQLVNGVDPQHPTPRPRRIRQHSDGPGSSALTPIGLPYMFPAR